jgi:hypothetical protein
VKALTGRKSPFPSIITEVIRWTKSGASAGTTGIGNSVEVAVDLGAELRADAGA